MFSHHEIPHPEHFVSSGMFPAEKDVKIVCESDIDCTLSCIIFVMCRSDSVTKPDYYYFCESNM